MKKSQPVQILLIAGMVLFGVGLILMPGIVNASVLDQAVYQTPTPNEVGQIIYTVQEGDTCTRIFLLTGVSIEQIVALNDLSEDCEIFPSQQLILGQVDPVADIPEDPQVDPDDDPDSEPPVEEPELEGEGEICVVLYEDLDGNQMRSQNELFLAGGVVSVNNRVGTYSETKETIGGNPALVDPVCFENVPEGEYNISMGIPEGYNATTSVNYALTVSAGDTIVIDFGAQPGAQMNNNAVGVVGGGRSPLLLAIGLFLLAGGAVLAFFFVRSQMES